MMQWRAPRLPERPHSNISLLTLAVWFGLITGLSQVVLRAILSLWLDRKVFYSLHVVWMAPLADATFFAVVGCLLWLLLRSFSPARRTQIGTVVFATLVVFSGYLLYPRVHWVAALILGLGVGLQAARWIAGHAEVFAKLVRRSLVAMCAVVVLSAGAVVARSKWIETRTLARLPTAPGGAPNVILLILDTVRSASMSLYGYARHTTPELEKLAARSVVFDQAYSTAPWTLPSHGSMFTGHFAHELSANWRTPLDSKYPTLAEVLRDRGYSTGGFVANMLYGTFEYGLNRGFVRYEDTPVTLAAIAKSSLLTRTVVVRLRLLMHNGHPLARKTAQDVNAEFLRWESRQKGRPYFAFLNYMDAHSPYLPPAPYDTLFGPRKTQLELSLDTPNWSPAQIQMEVDAYDGGIAYIDSQIGRLLAELERRGGLKNTIVIVASDHGEHMGEHRILYHANSLYQELLHVPLLIKLPQQSTPLRVAAPVTLADLPATVTDLIGFNQHRFSGNSLAHFWDPARAAPTTPTPLLASVRKSIGMPAWLPVAKGDMGSLMQDGWHFIRGGDGTEELYNLTADPRELHNLAKEPASVNQFQNLQRSLSALMSGGAAQNVTIHNGK